MQQTTPDPAPRKRWLLQGAVIGALALAGTVVGVGALAGAQDEPQPTDPPPPAAGAGPGAETDSEGDTDPGHEAWAAFDECLDQQHGTTEEPADDADNAAWEAFEQQWLAAEEACRDQLPPEIREEMAAFDAFDACLTEQLGDTAGEFPGELDFGTAVHIEGPDGFEMIEFGEGQGTVTITGDAEGVSVTTDGDVTVFTEADLEAEWEAFDAAHAACEQLLPDDALLDGEFLDGPWPDEEIPENADA